MANPNIKLATSDPPPRNPSRVALAAAIAHRDGAERELAVAREAVRQARGKRFKAQDRLDTLRAAREEDAAAQSLGAVFIASIAAGEACGLADLEPASTRRDEDDLEHEIETWTQTQAACEATVKAVESSLPMANFYVGEAAREAVKASGVVPSLLDGLAALHDELDKRLSVLAYLRFKNVIPEVDMAPALAAVRRPVLLGDYHPICEAWTTVFKTLERDADAELPQ